MKRHGGPIHDAMTIAWLLRPELFTTREAVVDVHVDGYASGLTRADFLATADRAPNAVVATAVDEADYIAFLAERIASFEHPVVQRGNET
jgi:purine nucleosidase